MSSGGEVTAEFLMEAAAPVFRRLDALRPTLKEPLRKVVDHLRAHLLRPDLRVEELFSESGTTKGNSTKTRFTAELGLAPREFLEACRLEVALGLLHSAPGLPARAVAEAAGYEHENTFHVAFKRCLGVGPGKVRQLFAAGLLEPSSLEPRHVREALERLAGGVERSVPGSQAWPGREEGLEALENRFFREVLNDWQRTVPESELRELGTIGFRFKTKELFLGLLRLSREGCRHDRKLGVRIAEAAQDALEAVADQLSAEEHVNLKVQGLAWLANAHRLATEWVEAETIFREAELVMVGHPVSSETEATFLLNKGFFRAVQRRVPEATELLDRACSLWASLGDPVRLSEALLARGRTRLLQRLPAVAVDDFREAWGHLERVVPTQLYLLASAAGHLAEAKWAAGAIAEAMRSCHSAVAFATRLRSPALLARLRWLEGLIANARGKRCWAERCLREARTSLLSAGEASMAALATLDIAVINLERERPEMAERLALEATPVLGTLGLDTEAMASLRLLEEATMARRLTAEAIEALRKRLEDQLDAPAWLRVRAATNLPEKI